jgi:hypothetical protein
MLSSVVSQSYLLENEVYLTDFLANANREEIGGLKCLVFVRPTAINVDLVIRELYEPRYPEYHICILIDDVNASFRKICQTV